MTVLAPEFWKVRNIPGLPSFAAGPFPMFFCREIMLRSRPGAGSRPSGARARTGRISCSERGRDVALRRSLRQLELRKAVFFHSVWLDLSREDVVNARVLTKSERQ